VLVSGREFAAHIKFQYNARYTRNADEYTRKHFASQDHYYAGNHHQRCSQEADPSIFHPAKVISLLWNNLFFLGASRRVVIYLFRRRDRAVRCERLANFKCNPMRRTSPSRSFGGARRGLLTLPDRSLRRRIALKVRFAALRCRPSRYTVQLNIQALS
jgi:hypothetical protein